VGAFNFAKVLLKLVWDWPIVCFIINIGGHFWIVFCETSEGAMEKLYVELTLWLTTASFEV